MSPRCRRAGSEQDANEVWMVGMTVNCVASSKIERRQPQCRSKVVWSCQLAREGRSCRNCPKVLNESIRKGRFA